MYIHVYIYICAVKFKAGPMFALFKDTFGPFLLVFEDLVLPAERRIPFFLNNEINTFQGYKLVQLCCAACLDQFLTLTWTSFNFRVLFLFCFFFGGGGGVYQHASIERSRCTSICVQ